MPAYPPAATVDTSTLAPLASPTFTGTATSPSFTASGKTGSTATPVILAGGTASGAPTTGAHVVGELVLDAAGWSWYCITAGTPGTWVRAGVRNKFFIRTAGDLTCNSTAWANLPTIGTAWDAVLVAQVGDTVECGLSASASGNAVYLCLDAVTVVGGVVTTSIGSGGAPSNSNGGVKAWAVTGNVNYDGGVGGSVMYALQGGDISAGTVTIRPRFRTLTAANKTLFATAVDPLHFWVKNLGPAS